MEKINILNKLKDINLSKEQKLKVIDVIEEIHNSNSQEVVYVSLNMENYKMTVTINDETYTPTYSTHDTDDEVLYYHDSYLYDAIKNISKKIDVTIIIFAYNNLIGLKCRYIADCKENVDNKEVYLIIPNIQDTDGYTKISIKYPMLPG